MWAARFKCKKAILPINYLGLPLGARPCALSFWKDIIRRCETRLASWKKKFLNKGNRLVLIKSVLSSIPIYYMSIIKMPIGVAHAMEKLQWNFFWGDGLEKRKFHSVDWASIWKSKRGGGALVWGAS
ncbi:hypothetical protein Ddye_000637 [Dipteronia dyeriana]|uniref:Uncharacterized protein n=1 Tax=Dipteronia dyeriana TaxID=168575 RepID=A0AAD9XNF0_9ROSI|nr:hypothetical protein Ddye_000637 [Dipteronia dyeriana]